MLAQQQQAAGGTTTYAGPPMVNPSGQFSTPEEWLAWRMNQTPVFSRNNVTYIGPNANLRTIRAMKERGAKKGDSGMLELRKPAYKGGSTKAKAPKTEKKSEKIKELPNKKPAPGG
jgi:hypothetical protein